MQEDALVQLFPAQIPSCGNYGIRAFQHTRTLAIGTDRPLQSNTMRGRILPGFLTLPTQLDQDLGARQGWVIFSDRQSL